MRYATDGEFALANKHDVLMVKFLEKFDLTEKEKRKFLANRSGLIKMAKSFKAKLNPVVVSHNVAMQDDTEKEHKLFEKIAPNGTINIHGHTLEATSYYDKGDGIKSVVKVDMKTFEPVELYASINSASRSCGLVVGRKLRNALYRGNLEVEGFYWIMAERMKVCSIRKEWITLGQRYKYKTRKTDFAYSSACKTCDNARDHR